MPPSQIRKDVALSLSFYLFFSGDKGLTKKNTAHQYLYGFFYEGVKRGKWSVKNSFAWRRRNWFCNA